MGQDEKDFPKVVKMGQLRILLSKKPVDGTPNPFDEEEGLLNIGDDDDPFLGKRKPLVRFFDMGQERTLEGDAFEDLRYVLSKPYTVAVAGSGGYSQTWRVDQFLDTDWEDYQNYITGTNHSLWTKRFRPIDLKNIELQYHVFLNGAGLGKDPTYPIIGGEYWIPGKLTTKGLLLKKNLDYIQMAESGYTPYFGFDTRDTTTYKITTEFDPTADRVTIPMSKKMDIFLVPKIFLNVFSSGDDTIGISLNEMMDFNYRPLPRKSFPFYQTGINPLGPFPGNGGVNVNKVTTATDPNGTFAAFLAYSKTRTGVRAHTASQLGTPPGSGSASSPSGFAVAEDSWYYTNTRARIAGTSNPGGIWRQIEPSNYHIDFNSFFFNIDSIPLPQHMIGAVKSKGKLYYIWAPQDEFVGQMSFFTTTGTNPWNLSMNGGTFADE